jgi:DNA-binding beta-propeller fold protein YncE
VDQATDTIYVLSPGHPGTVSVIDGNKRNGTVTTGCRNAPPTVTVGNGILGADFFAGLAVNEVTNTVYAVNTADGTVSVINGPPATRWSPPPAARPRLT